MGLFWFDREITGDYSLKLDWKLHGDDNSGVFLGFPASDDPWSAVDNGYEIQIDATDAADRTTGAVYGFRSADVAARDAALNPPGSGTPTNSVSPASAWRSSSTAGRSTTSPTPTRRAACARATSACRTTATATRRPSATCASSATAPPPAPVPVR